MTSSPLAFRRSPWQELSGLLGGSVVLLLGDDGLKQTDDLLLPGGHGVEPAPHLDEAVVDMVTQVYEVVTQVYEVVSERVETRSGGSAEVADFAPKLTDVPVGGTGENTRGRRVLLT